MVDGPPKGWILREHPAFSETDLPLHWKEMIRILERFCRSKAYCRATTAQIAEKAHLTERYVALTLARMEAAGVILRVMDESTAKSVRLGIVLRVRTDPERPVGDTSEALKQFVDELLKEVVDEATHQPRRALSTAPYRALFEAPYTPFRALSTAPCYRGIKESLSFEEDPKDGKPSDSRRRLEDTPARPLSPPEPVVLPPPPPAAPPKPAVVSPALPTASTPADELTPSQREWLDALDSDRRARFDGLNPRMQAYLLEGFRHGIDRIAVANAEAAIGRPPLPPPPGPTASPRTLLEALAGRYGASQAPVATRALMTLLGDREESWGPIYQLCLSVASGSRPLASLLDPLERTLAAMEGGKEFRRGAGAYWMASVQNWDREQGGGKKDRSPGTLDQKFPGDRRSKARPMDHCT